MHRYRLPAVSASYPPAQEADNDPLMVEPIFDGDEEIGTLEEGQLVPYAHRDIKPGYVRPTRRMLNNQEHNDCRR
jgi:serine/threonine kinase 16